MEVEESSKTRGSSDPIPESVMEAVKRTANNLEELSAQLDEYLPLCDPDVLSRLPPLERAQALLLLSKAATALFALRLRCKGIDPENHPVKSELERLKLYDGKVQQCVDLSKAPLRPSVTVNPQAASRVIAHSLPDISSEQKQSLREISNGEATRLRFLERSVHKRRKYQSTEKQSVRAAAQEFLEKATRELLGDNSSGFKGPLQPQASEEDILPVD